MLFAAAALNSSDAKEAKEVFTKVLSRLALFGALPPSILPALVSVRMKVDLPKTADRKLLRIVNYLIQLAAGEGSAGTVVPFSPMLGELPKVLGVQGHVACVQEHGITAIPSVSSFISSVGIASEPKQLQAMQQQQQLVRSA